MLRRPERRGRAPNLTLPQLLYLRFSDNSSNINKLSSGALPSFWSMDRTSRSQRSQDDWLVAMLVAVMKFWLFVGIAVFKAASIVGKDPETIKAFSALLQPTSEVNVDSGELPSHSPSTSTATEFLHGIRHQMNVARSQVSEGESSNVFYAITEGLDVGITGCSAVVDSLTTGVSRSCQQHFNSREEAIQHYLSSLRAGIVHRIRANTLPNGHTERHSETLESNGEVRDLDVRLALAGASVLRELHGFSTSATRRSPKIFSHPVLTESDGLVMPNEWLFTRMPCPESTPASSDGLVCPTSTPVVFANQATAGRVIVLTDDEEESETSQQVQGDVTPLDLSEASSHTSDQYYTSDLDEAMNAVIEEEEVAARHSE